MLYQNVRGKGRVSTREYEAWKREAGWTLQAQRPTKFRGPVTVAVELCPPHNRRFDLDNKNKCLLDLLVRHNVIPDDHSDIVREVNVKRVEQGAPCTIIVRSIL
jgi:Holliday junction resolvase RusA-like endonuclease